LQKTPSLLSLMSLGEDKSTDEADPVRMSEKARGKMRERASSIDEGELGDPGAPGPYRSRSGFTPTENCAGSCLSWRKLTHSQGSRLGASISRSTPFSFC
jgi:hypothetical protein